MADIFPYTAVVLKAHEETVLYLGRDLKGKCQTVASAAAAGIADAGIEVKPVRAFTLLRKRRDFIQEPL